MPNHNLNESCYHCGSPDESDDLMQAEIEKYPQQLRELLKPLEQLRYDFSRKSKAGDRSTLTSLKLSGLFDQPIVDKNMARCCHSGLWLLHGFLNESHEISQSIKTAEGSFWHAIMHRAEGDFWNSKYWYRQVRTHSVLDQLNSNGVSGEELVDLCERTSLSAEAQGIATKLVKTEWLLLFEHCWSRATAL